MKGSVHMYEYALTESNISDSIKMLTDSRDKFYHNLTYNVLGIYFTCKQYNEKYNFTQEQHRNWQIVEQAFRPIVNTIRDLFPEQYINAKNTVFHWDTEERDNRITQLFKETTAPESPHTNKKINLIQANYLATETLLRLEDYLISHSNEEMSERLTASFKYIRSVNSICAQLATLLNQFCTWLPACNLKDPMPDLPEKINEYMLYLPTS